MPHNSFIEKALRKVYVDEMIMDLIPNFIRTRNDDLKRLKLALQTKDYEKVKRIGHNWKGVGSTFGFHLLTMAGERLEILAFNTDEAALNELIESLPQYLENIEIEAKPTYEKMKLFTDNKEHFDI